MWTACATAAGVCGTQRGIDLYRVAIVEDDRAAGARYAEFVRENAPFEAAVRQFSSAEEYEQARGPAPDIAILDVELGGKSGLQLAAELNVKNPACQVVFLTAHQQYNMDAYRTEHVYYVLKTGLETHLPLALAKAAERLEQTENGRLLVKQGDAAAAVLFRDILYMERYGRATFIHCQGGREYVSGDNFPAMLKKLDRGEFCVSHRNFLVNLRHVRDVDKKAMTLSSGVQIPLSRNRYKPLLNALAGYLGGGG